MKIDWTQVEELVGLPDYAVVFSTWPWPDGGWMAGLCLTDKEWAKKQKLPGAICRLKEVFDPKWSVTDGFENGINVHAGDVKEAIEKLYDLVKTAA